MFNNTTTLAKIAQQKVAKTFTLIYPFLKCNKFVKDLLHNSQKDKPDSQPATSSVAEIPVSISSTRQSRKKRYSADSNKDEYNYDVNMSMFSNDCIITKTKYFYF